MLGNGGFDVEINEDLEKVHIKFYVEDGVPDGIQYNWGNTSNIVLTMNQVLEYWVEEGIFTPILGIKVTNATILVIKPYSGI